MSKDPQAQTLRGLLEPQRVGTGRPHTGLCRLDAMPPIFEKIYENERKPKVNDQRK